MPLEQSQNQPVVESKSDDPLLKAISLVFNPAIFSKRYPETSAGAQQHFVDIMTKTLQDTSDSLSIKMPTHHLL